MPRLQLAPTAAALHCARTAAVATSPPQRVADVPPLPCRSSYAEPPPHQRRSASRRIRNRASGHQNGPAQSQRVPLRPLLRMLPADLRHLAKNSDCQRIVSLPSLLHIRVTSQFTHCAIVNVPATHLSLPPPRSMRIRSYSATASSQYDNPAKSIPASSPAENPDWTSPAKLAAEGARNFRRLPPPATPSRLQVPSPARLRTRACVRRSAPAPRSARTRPRSRLRPQLRAALASDRAPCPCEPPLARPTATRSSSSRGLPQPPRLLSGLHLP